MSKSQRTKGAAYEREVCHEIEAALGVKAMRNIGQARDGGCDIPIGFYSIECKRRHSLKTLEAWMAQSERAAVTGITPIVVMRQDEGESMVLLRLSDFLKVGRRELWGI